MKEIDRILLMIERGFTYDPKTGEVKTPTGKISNSPNIEGYLRLRLYIDTKTTYTIRLHRFAFYYIYNYLPNIIDHIDRNRQNNKISNLRKATSLLNNNNRTKRFT